MSDEVFDLCLTGYERGVALAALAAYRQRCLQLLADGPREHRALLWLNASTAYTVAEKLGYSLPEPRLTTELASVGAEGEERVK